MERQNEKNIFSFVKTRTLMNIKILQIELFAFPTTG